MKKLSLIIFSIIFLFCNIAIAQDITFEASYVSYDLEKVERWKATTIIEKIDNGVFKLTEIGSGKYYPFKEEISWKSVLSFEIVKKRIKLQKSTRKIFDKTGNLIAIEKQTYSYQARKLIYSYQDISNDTITEKSFYFTKDIVNRLALPIYIREFLKNGETKRVVQMVTEEPKLYNMNLRVVSDEIINIGNGKEEVLKVVIDPNLGLFNIFKVLIPKSYIWHNKNDEFTMRMYKGLESSPSSPKIRIVVE